MAAEPRPSFDALRAQAAAYSGGLIVVTAALLGAVAVYNGYPLLFFDTEMYLHPTTNVIRPPFYALILCPMHLGRSLWPVAFWQSAILSHLLYLTTRATFPGRRRRDHLLVVLAVTVLSSAPWFTASVMPDVYAAVLVLTAYLLAWRRAALGRAEWIYLHALCVVAIVVHSSNVPLALGLLVLVGGMRIACRRIGGWGGARVGPLALSLAAAVGLLLTTNTLLHGRVSVSPSAYAFLLARLVADGPATAYLRECEPPDRYALCRYAGELPMNSNAFLWGRGSPLRKVGGIEGYAAEGTEIVARTVCRYPLWTLGTAVTNTALQLTRLHLGAAFPSLADFDWLASRMRTHFPGELAAFQASRQNRTALPLDALQWVHLAGLVLGAAAAAAALVRARATRNRAPFVLLVTIAAGVLMSAAITGALSEPAPRYLARIVWLIPYFGCAAWIGPGSGRRTWSS
ncbi:MAG: hypothetical protein JXQ29_13385 [Planctomycetes bacterium]|nr:hypothetical protein [Planctomycetota bacterium]